MKKRIILAGGVGLLSGVLWFAGYAASNDGHARPAESVGAESRDGLPEDSHDDEVEIIHLTEAQRKLIDIRLEHAVAGEVDDMLQLNGEVRLNLDRTARIMPHMPGFVSRILVREGETVAKGQLLAVLTSHKLGEYYSNYNSALELEKLALSEFQMAEKLKDGRATSEKEYLRYKREYADAVIARQQAEQLLRSLLLDPAHGDHAHEPLEVERSPICTNYEVRSPLAGSIIQKNITLGENFPEDNAGVIFTVSDLAEPWVELRANSAELGLLKDGDAVQVRSVASGTPYPGRIVYIAPVIDESTRTGLVRVRVDNSAGALRPGQFVTGTVRTGRETPAVLVPREAVQLIGGETAVFVPDGDGFVPRAVVTGRSAGGFTQLLAGLSAGEEFVAAGAFELKAILLTMPDTAIEPRTER